MLPGKEQKRKTRSSQLAHQTELPQMSKPKKNKLQKTNNLFGLEVKTIILKTENQREAAIHWEQGNHVLMTGFAGTGKTFLALSFALHALERKEQNKVVIVRSAIQTRDIGFMPGNLIEKTALYQVPYQDIVNNLCGRDDAYGILAGHGSVEFMTTSFVRGLTIDNAVVIVDECQNMDEHEMESIVTRLGNNSRLIVCGDDKQSDLHQFKYPKTVEVLSKMNQVGSVSFEVQDIVRSDFVKQYLLMKYDS